MGKLDETQLSSLSAYVASFFSYLCHHKGHSQQLISLTFKWKFKSYASRLI